MVNKRLFFIASLYTLLNFSNACNASTSALTRQIYELTQTIKSLSAEIKLLKKQLPNATPRALRFYKIRSLSDLGSWSWNNKGNIALTGCGLTLIYVVCSASQEARKTRKLILDLFAKLKQMHQEGINQRQTLLNGINDLRVQQNLQPLAFANQQDHQLENPDDSWTAKAWNGMCYAGNKIKSSAFNLLPW